jgi:hypothetical protein
MSARDMARRGVCLYHYSLVFPRQVYNKAVYYRTLDPLKIAEGGGYNCKIGSWEEEVYWKLRRPFRVHNVLGHLSWLKRFRGRHPAEMNRMMDDIRSGKLAVELRPTDDIERLLTNPVYNMAASVLNACARVSCTPPARLLYRIFRGVVRHLGGRSEDV